MLQEVLKSSRYRWGNRGWDSLSNLPQWDLNLEGESGEKEKTNRWEASHAPEVVEQSCTATSGSSDAQQGKSGVGSPTVWFLSFPPHPVENKARPNTKNKKGQTQNLPSSLTEMEKVTPSTVHLTRTLSQWLKSFIPTSYHQSLIIHKCKIKARIKWHPWYHWWNR